MATPIQIPRLRLALALTALLSACAVNPVPTPEKTSWSASGSGAYAPADAAKTQTGGADAGTTADNSAKDAAAVPAADAVMGPDAAGTGADAVGGDAASSPKPKAMVAISDAQPGLQYNGGLAYQRKAAQGLGYETEFVEISAPILPKTNVIYNFEGSNFPKSVAEMAKVTHDAALTYDWLLNACAKDYPEITLVPPGMPMKLPTEKLKANYGATANCAYDDYTSKPYWTPKLVDQVDICAAELGPDWALLTEADVATITPEQHQLMVDALTAGGDMQLGEFYFSLKVFVRGKNGVLQTVNLEPNAKLVSIEDAMPCKVCFPDAWTYHFEAGVGLRCLRIRGVKPQ